MYQVMDMYCDVGQDLSMPFLKFLQFRKEFFLWKCGVCETCLWVHVTLVY